VTNAASLTSAEVRRRLDHPVIDADGHLVECPPVLIDFLKQVGGQRMADRWVQRMRDGAWGEWTKLSPAERKDRGIIRHPFWNVTSNAKDRATAMLPSLLRERLDEFGIDFQVLYPSVGIPFISGSIDPELRQVMCRALNTMYAELFRDHRDRFAPAATIPTHTPQEALAEIDYAIGKLGLKAAMIAGTVQRPLKAVAKAMPEYAAHAYWVDPLALDGEYDYDPVWQRFLDVGVVPATHNNGTGWGTRRSTTNYVYNHVGHFAASAEGFAKALVLGGVTKRFPTLKFGLLEGGVGWAASLYNDLCEHFEKRSVPALRANLNPFAVDFAAVRRYVEKYGSEHFRRHAATIEQGWDSALQTPNGHEPEPSDDFGASGVRRTRDLAKIFSENFYVGCEADDRMTAVAFNDRLHHHGIKLRAMLGSDIGHWDVTDMTHVIAEAWGLVEDELLSAEDFRAFVCGNVAQLHGGMNRDFFKGTVVENAAATILAAPRQAVA